MPSKKFPELIARLPRRHASLLIRLRTNHVPLQFHWARIGKAESGICPACGNGCETVAHYLLVCESYRLQRAVHFRMLGHSGRTLATLLNSTDALRPLFNYINTTQRFRASLGSLDYPDSDSEVDD
ncbi:hypothetical protein C8Q79DRAFT_1003440 [Trametes meyenii]|nr:hypothetical protein C8Q79DRAFT_1003440 [Trametes meyenii]